MKEGAKERVTNMRRFFAFSCLLVDSGSILAPAHLYATEAGVYSALFVLFSIVSLTVRFLSWKYLNFKGSKKKKNIPKLDFCKDTPIEPK